MIQQRNAVFYSVLIPRLPPYVDIDSEVPGSSFQQADHEIIQHSPGVVGYNQIPIIELLISEMRRRRTGHGPCDHIVYPVYIKHKRDEILVSVKHRILASRKDIHEIDAELPEQRGRLHSGEVSGLFEERCQLSVVVVMRSQYRPIRCDIPVDLISEPIPHEIHIGLKYDALHQITDSIGAGVIFIPFGCIIRIDKFRLPGRVLFYDR